MKYKIERETTKKDVTYQKSKPDQMIGLTALKNTKNAHTNTKYTK